MRRLNQMGDRGRTLQTSDGKGRELPFFKTDQMREAAVHRRRNLKPNTQRCSRKTYTGMRNHFASSRRVEIGQRGKDFGTGAPAHTDNGSDTPVCPAALHISAATPPASRD